MVLFGNHRPIDRDRRFIRSALALIEAVAPISWADFRIAIHPPQERRTPDARVRERQDRSMLHADPASMRGNRSKKLEG